MTGDERRGGEEGAGLNLSALRDRERGDPGAEGDLTGGDGAPDDSSSRSDLAPGNAPFGTGSPAGLDAGQIATEAASYGPADGALADAARNRRGRPPEGESREGNPPGPTLGEAVAQATGRGDVGTPGGRGGTGGGGPAGLQGGTGAQGSGAPSDAASATRQDADRPLDAARDRH